jgi:phospholipid/cholesterol/gamma-HCH transport system permease protein
MSKTPATAPEFSVEKDGAAVLLRLRGAWVIAASRALERAAESLGAAAAGGEKVAIDLAGVERLDTAGAWLIDKARAGMRAGAYVNASHEQQILLEAAAYTPLEPVLAPPGGPVLAMLARLGEWTLGLRDTIVGGVSFLGELTLGVIRVLKNPALTRPTPMVFHLESFALRAVPVIATINFLVGCIVAQQGIFQLNRFGASTYAVDLVGVLVLRELGVLLTSIMIAGRSGSAITAELGSMKMREEIDALTTMGFDPAEFLILPRVLALVIAVPALTFIGSISALAGGGAVAWAYAGMSPPIYIARLAEAVSLENFEVGMVKAPFMALVIGIVASVEGLRVEGSTESLGLRTTTSVVKSIFLAILLDGVFAIFFAAIGI